MQKCKHFSLQELVPRHVYEEKGEFAWIFLDDRALITLDQLRERFGTAVVNNWCWGGSRQWSGLRTEKSPVGSAYSQHRFGRAFDVLFSEYSAADVRSYVLNNPEEFPYIKGIEKGVNWFHFDCGNRPLGKYRIWTFSK